MLKELKLNELKSPYIDLADFGKEVVFTGDHTGNRLVIKNASNKLILLDGCTITSTRNADDKDALVFADELENCTIIGKNCRIIYGGVSFWGVLENVKILSLDIYYANQALRISGNHANRNVEIKQCNIIAPEREGIYFGPHYLQEKPSVGLVIAYNTISYSGWDAIQFNCQMAKIFGNVINYAAQLEEKDQWFGILAQPGSLGWVHDNIITGTKRPIGSLDSRVFHYAHESKSESDEN